MYKLRQYLRLLLGLYGLTLFASHGLAASVYLPVNINPIYANKIEQVFTLAQLPQVKKPYTLAEVDIALKEIALDYPALAQDLNDYLTRFRTSRSIQYFNLEVSHPTGTDTSVANGRGETTHSNWSGEIAGHWQVNPYVLVNLGGQFFDGASDAKNQSLEGSYLSLGIDSMQVDIGARSHWWGPFQESDMLISTQAIALPSVTISNVTPFKFAGMRYELFYGRMSHSDEILSQDRDERLAGYPKIFGMHLGFSPLQGFNIGFNRLVQYGGANRDDSWSSLYKAVLLPKDNDNIKRTGTDFGNQVTSVTTHYSFSGRLPFSLYMEYAGEDTSQSSSWHLGNSALHFGVFFPQITPNTTLNYEWGEWQNAWYVNGNYGDGLTNYGSVLGHWGAQRGQKGLGASAQTLKLTHQFSNKQSVISRFRTIEIDTYVNTGHELELEYHVPWNNHFVGITGIVGKDVNNDGYTRISGSLKW